MKVFDKMDTDQDGLISCDQIDIQNLPKDFVQLIFPVLCQIDDSKVSYDIFTFSDIMFQFYDVKINYHLFLYSKFIFFNKQDLDLDKKNKFLKMITDLKD